MEVGNRLVQFITVLGTRKSMIKDCIWRGPSSWLTTRQKPQEEGGRRGRKEARLNWSICSGTWFYQPTPKTTLIRSWEQSPCDLVTSQNSQLQILLQCQFNMCSWWHSSIIRYKIQKLNFKSFSRRMLLNISLTLENWIWFKHKT